MLEKNKIDIKDLPFAYIEEGMCAYCNLILSTVKINGKFICCDCRAKLTKVLYQEFGVIPYVWS
jgi:hypothetical protein